MEICSDYCASIKNNDQFYYVQCIFGLDSIGLKFVFLILYGKSHLSCNPSGSISRLLCCC
jgi:hypothetical protein